MKISSTQKKIIRRKIYNQKLKIMLILTTDIKLKKIMFKNPQLEGL